MITRMLREEFRKMYGGEAIPQEVIEMVARMQINAVKIRHALASLKKK